MKKLIIATGLVFAASTGVFAQSSALDFQAPQNASRGAIGIDATATASIGVSQDMLGGSHADRHRASNSSNLNPHVFVPRLGDGDQVLLR